MTTYSPWNKFPKNWGELSQVLQKIGTSIGLHAHLKADITDFAHKTTHQNGGADAIKLDDLAAPEDNADLDAGTATHGLLIKATAPAAGFRNIVAIDNGETVYKNAALFDATVPEALGVAATGTAMTAARRDHVHASPPAAGIAVPESFAWFVS